MDRSKEKIRLLKWLGVGFFFLFLAYLCGSGYNALGNKNREILATAVQTGSVDDALKSPTVVKNNEKRSDFLFYTLVSGLLGLGIIIVCPIRYWIKKP